MDQLPVDVLIDILSRLPIKSLMRCRCVSKPLLNLTHNPQFTRAQLSRSSQINHPNLLLNGDPGGTNHSRVFLFQHEYHDNFDYFFCTIFRFVVPYSWNTWNQFRVVGSCNGLLCLVHRRFREIIYVRNPFTGECVRVPDPINHLQLQTEDENQMVIGFGFSPEFNEYKVVQIVHDPSIQAGVSRVFVFTLGDESWRDLGEVGYTFRSVKAGSKGSWRDFQGVSYTFTTKWVGSVFLNGALHWLCSSPDNLIVSFDVVDEVFGVIPCPEECGTWSLGVLSECLSITAYCGDRLEIWFMGDYGVKGSWTKRFVLEFTQFGYHLNASQSLCYQRDGKILFLISNDDLCLYNPQTEKLQFINFAGAPLQYDAVTHVASLVSPSRCLPRDKQLRNADGNAIDNKIKQLDLARK